MPIRLRIILYVYETWDRSLFIYLIGTLLNAQSEIYRRKIDSNPVLLVLIRWKNICSKVSSIERSRVKSGDVDHCGEDVFLSRIFWWRWILVESSQNDFSSYNELWTIVVKTKDWWILKRNGNEAFADCQLPLPSASRICETEKSKKW